MKNLICPLLYYSAAMLSIYMTYAMSQALTGHLPASFGTEPVEQALRLWLYTNSLVAAGFLTFGLTEGLPFPRSKSFLPLLMTIIGAGAAFFLPTSQGAAFLFLLIFLLLPVGYFAASAHYVLAMKIRAGLRGRFLGLAVTITVLVQYGLFTDGKEVAPLLMAAVFAITGALCHYCLREKIPQPENNDDELSPPPAPQYVVMLFVLVSLLAILHGCGDSMALTFYSQVDESLFHDNIRLFLPLGMLAAGVVADWRERHYLLSITAICLLLRVVSILTLETTQGFIFTLSVEYIISAFLIMCYTLYFLDLAPRTSHPALLAGMGRTLALPISALSANIFYVIGSFSNGFLTGYVLILVLINIFFYHSKFREWLEIPIQNTVPAPLPEPVSVPTEPTVEDEAALSQPPTLADWQEKFAFTPREMEVLQEVLTEKTAAEIAVVLGIKERTVRYHIANLLKKTGTSHRAELKLLLSLPLDIRE